MSGPRPRHAAPDLAYVPDQDGQVLRIYARAADGEALGADEVALLFHWLGRWRDVAGGLAHALDGTGSTHATAQLALTDYATVAAQWSQAVSG